MASANLLRAFKQDTGLSNEGLASLLAERTGRELTAVQVETLMGRKQANKWVVDALELKPEPMPEEPVSVFPPDWSDEDSPVEPDSPKPRGELEPASVFDFDVAETRLILVSAYQVAGKGAAYVGKNEAYERAFDLHAERCADAWIALARRDQKVARVLASLTSGGAWGQLVLIHLSLVMSMLVAAGKVGIPDLPMAPGMGPSHDANTNGAGSVDGSAQTPQPAAA